MKGIHMSPSFEGYLGCIKIKIFSNVMVQCASDLQGIPCFVPIHCLDTSTKNRSNEREKWTISKRCGFSYN